MVQVAAVVNLGCAKNAVDSEVIVGILHKAGYRISSKLEDSDLVVVNTCGFIESAVTENIDYILELAEYKLTGRLKRLVVVGCLVQRYGNELAKALPEVDIFLPGSEIGRIDLAIKDHYTLLTRPLAEEPYLYDDLAPRILSKANGSAYVKIAEGCNRLCGFCIIPKLRGRYRSRRLASVVDEISNLAAKGVREINLVAQDTTAFGSEHGDFDLVDLLTSIDRKCLVDWVRILYAYPLGVSDRLLDAMVELPSVCNYLDLPLQHVSDRILSAMARPRGKYSTRPLVEHIRRHAPSLCLRTTFIVGFPGETDDDVRELERFVAEGHFLNLGVFPYSAEEGTSAFALADKISLQEKNDRVERIMLAQQGVNRKHLKEYVGQKLDVLLEGVHPESDLLLQARTRFQAPEVDGVVIINELDDDSKEPKIGHIYPLEISDVVGYDLVGRLITSSQ